MSTVGQCLIAFIFTSLHAVDPSGASCVDYSTDYNSFNGTNEIVDNHYSDQHIIDTNTSSIQKFNGKLETINCDDTNVDICFIECYGYDCNGVNVNVIQNKQKIITTHGRC